MKGYKHMSKSFKAQDDAEKWLKENLYAMSKGLPYETKKMRSFNLGDLIDRYIANELIFIKKNYSLISSNSSSRFFIGGSSCFTTCQASARSTSKYS